MPTGIPFGENTKKQIFKQAKHCRFLTEIASNLNIKQPNLNRVMARFGVTDDIKLMLKQNRIERPIVLEKYTKEYLLFLAGSSYSLNHVGQRLGLCRERVRQLLELYKIHNKALIFFKLNRERMIKLLENAKPLTLNEIH